MFFTPRMALAALFTLSVATASAQTKTLQGIENMRRSALSPIYAGNEVKGYLLFAHGDKADRKNDNYLLNFYDQNLTEASKIVVQKPKNRFYLLDNSFNGSAFAFYFFNQKDETLELETYDTGLKKIGTKVIGELSKGDKMMIQNQLKMQGTSAFGGMGLMPVPGVGFLRNGYTGLSKGYTLAMYDDNLKMKWRLTSPENAKQYEMANVMESADKYLMGTIMRRDGIMSRKFETSMLVIDAATGKKIMDSPVETSKDEQLSLSSFTFDPAKREFVAVGEYYKPDDKPMVNKSQGFYIKRFSEAGKQVSSKMYGWQKEVAALMPAEAKESLEDNYVNFNHTVVKAANGKMYIIAEQFKIVGDGLGIAMAAMGGKASVSKGKVANMLVFELDPQAKLTNVKFYPKNITNAELPNGAGFLGAGLLGYIMKGQGDFDYQFLQKNDANTNFNAVYVNFDKEKGEAAKGYVGNIAFDENGKYTLDKIDLSSSTGATAAYLYPAKPGYVMMADYFRKKSQLGMRLIKLNI